MSRDGYTFWDAILAWRDEIYTSNLMRVTKTNYLSHMFKLIKGNIIDPYLPINKCLDSWFFDAFMKLYSVKNWSDATKSSRRTCLKSFFDFCKRYIPKQEPFGRSPSMLEIAIMLSSIIDRTKTKELDPVKLFDTLNKINVRDALIVSVMIFTGNSLKDVLDLKKEDLTDNHIVFSNGKKSIPKPLKKLISFSCDNSSEYLFATAKGKRILRTQVIRNLKIASHLMGLDFEATPKIIQGYAIAYISNDKKSKFEKILGNCK